MSVAGSTFRKEHLIILHSLLDPLDFPPARMTKYVSLDLTRTIPPQWGTYKGELESVLVLEEDIGGATTKNNANLPVTITTTPMVHPQLELGYQN